MTAAEARLENLDYQLCPHCDYEVKGDYLRCPSCMRKLKDRCTNCGKAVDPSWRLCPYCEAETGAGAASSKRGERKRRRSRGATEEEPALESPAPRGDTR